jgi:hypothetical protein
VAGLAAPGTSVRIVLRSPRAVIARRTLRASSAGRYAIFFGTGAARRVRARVTSAGLSRRTATIRPRRR